MAIRIEDMQTYAIVTVKAVTLREDAGKLVDGYGYPSNILHYTNGCGKYMFERWYSEPDGRWTIPEQETTWKGNWDYLTLPLVEIEAIEEDGKIFINTQSHTCEERYIWHRFQKEGYYKKEDRSMTILGLPSISDDRLFRQAAHTKEGKFMVDKINSCTGYVFKDMDENVEIPWHYKEVFEGVKEKHRRW